MSTKFFTNNESNTLINKFEGVFKNNPQITIFDALVGYFRASGYFRIRPFLDNISKIRILVGINVDILVNKANSAGLEYLAKDDKTREDFKRNLLKDIESAEYTKEIDLGILQLINDIIEKKIIIKAHPSKKIHAKFYILRPENFNKYTQASVITGSSNLTDPGLGAGNNFNYEFNVELSDHDDVKFASDEFERLWEEAVEILATDMNEIKEKSHVNPDLTPFEIYIKMLIEYFGKSIDYDINTLGDLPSNFKKLSYQMDAVNDGYNRLLVQNGFFLSDVVGLGKTVIATLVAKKFILQNGIDRTKILVVYPPAVEHNWKNTFREFDLDKYTKFISNGSLSKILDGDPDYWPARDYDLVIVDESHKFRSHTTDGFDLLQIICKTPRKNIGHVPGRKKKVILVSATPLNNKPEDILNQVLLFQDARRSSLTNLTTFFAPLIQKYKEMKKDLDIDVLRDIYAQIRETVVAPITIRRTRKDLENIAEYKRDIESQGIKFPKVQEPIKIYYEFDEKLDALFNKTMEYLTAKDKINYFRYQAIAHLNPDIQDTYYEQAELSAKSLATIMKTQLVKRLESSFEAFKKSLSNFRIATDRMIDMFDKDCIFVAPDLDVNDLQNKGKTFDEIKKEVEKKAKKNEKNRIFKKSDFDSNFLELLKNDSALIAEIEEEWKKIDYDPKLTEFLHRIKNEFFDKKKNLNQKLVIFSESKDTVDYLKKALENEGRKDVLAISSENRRDNYQNIMENFDANFPNEVQKKNGEKQKDDFKIILTTEVLAEGVNLHRSNVVIHYDTPWNSTKMMQRIGRVNRIGSEADFIYNFVFYPSKQGNAQIDLEKTAFMKIQAFHTAFGEDNQIFSDDEIIDDITLYNKNGDDEEEDEKLKYLFFLRNFKKENRQLFDKICKIPLKSFVGRDPEKSNNINNSQHTIAFMKTSKKIDFYKVKSNGIPVKIQPIEAFKIYEATKDEIGVPLIDEHYDNVINALNEFYKKEEKEVAEYYNNNSKGAIVNSAKRIIKDILNSPQIIEKRRANYLTLLKFIDLGVYSNLANAVYKLSKAKSLKLDYFIKGLDDICKTFQIDENFEDDNQLDDNIIIEKPIIIISESFK